MATVNIYHTCPTNPRVATLIRTEDGKTERRAVKLEYRVAPVVNT